MRKIGSLYTLADAERFRGYLNQNKIENRVDEVDGHWQFWIYEESQVQKTSEELAEYQVNPQASKFQVKKISIDPAPVVEQPKKRDVEKISRNFNQDTQRGPFSICLIVIVACIWASVVSKFGSDPVITSKLLIASKPALGLTEISSGQVWRLFSPMILHFGMLHLIFNIYMFWMLASAIERIKGNWILLGIVVFTNLTANLTQFYWAGPNFGGLSGVVYGVFGYLWIRSRVLPGDGFYIPSSLVMQLLMWGVICIVISDIMPVANAAHFGGLLGGMLLGALPRLWRTA